MSVRKIAKELGISPSAVSLALRGSVKISELMRRRVHKVAKRLGYRPSAKISELMAQMRATREPGSEGCLGLVSLYEHPRPWELSKHLLGIHRSMQKRAADLGYRLESFWLRGPGMTPKRWRGILGARNIQGLLCFGSPRLDDDFPSELDHNAVVTLGLSIQTPLHRITSHFYNDATHILDRVYAQGYRRPGLVIGQYEEVRTAYALGAYLGWCERHLRDEPPIPVLRLNWIEAKPFSNWYRLHRPDVIVVVLLGDALPELTEILKQNGLKVPGQLGVAVLTHFLEETSYSGIQQNQSLMGAWAVELLVGRINNRDFGIPTHPRVEMVEGNWIEGKSL